MNAAEIVAWIERDSERTRTAGCPDDAGWMWQRWARVTINHSGSRAQAESEAQQWADKDGMPATVYVDRNDGRSWLPWMVVYPSKEQR